MKNLKRTLAVMFLSMLCTANVALAIPEKPDEDGNTSSVIVTEVEKKSDKSEKSTKKPSEKSTEKATAKASPKASAKASEKATAKASPKATKKASEKASEKATAKASEKNNDEDSDKIVLETVDDDDVLVVENTEEPAINIQGDSAKFENSKYVTKGGAFLWFLFGVIVSAVISYYISYRFFKISKKDNHLIAELRALKRDIDSKMVGTVNGFSEYDITVNNNNPSYAKSDNPIKSKRSEEDEEKNEEIFKKWESQLQNTGRITRISEEINTRNRTGNNHDYPANRKPSYDRRRPAQKKTGIVNKVKNVIDNLFPYDE